MVKTLQITITTFILLNDHFSLFQFFLLAKVDVGIFKPRTSRSLTHIYILVELYLL